MCCAMVIFQLCGQRLLCVQGETYSISSWLFPPTLDKTDCSLSHTNMHQFLYGFFFIIIIIYRKIYSILQYVEQAFPCLL